MLADALVVLVTVIAGAVSPVTEFGIGSLLTPVLALHVDTRLAVTALSIPYVIGTAIRFWRLHSGVDQRVLWSFGLTSASGFKVFQHRFRHSGGFMATLHAWKRLPSVQNG